MTATRPLGSLYLVATPRASLAEREFLARVRAALEGGVDLLQLRCKEMDALPSLRLANKVAALARDAGIPFIINDRPDIALAAGADGVHLGQEDLPLEWARRILPGSIVGRSSHAPSQAEQAVAEGASYFAVGPVWPTPTKPGRTAVGLSYVRDVASRTMPIPWFAIGGITLDNVGEVLEAGGTRIALVRAVLDAPDPAVAAHGFVQAIQHAQSSAAEEVTCT